MKAPRVHLLITGALALCAGLLVSGWRPYDRTTWWLEVLPVLVGLPLLVKTYARWPWTDLVYGVLFVHALVLIVGGAYTYARVPLGASVAEWFGLERNPFDKLGHFLQGLTPALVCREALLRRGSVRGRRLLGVLLIAIALAVSALYELIEWWAALLLGQGADAFLGTQGDPWDTQSDMMFAGIGASVVVSCLSRIHDAHLARLAHRNERPATRDEGEAERGKRDAR
jgi:putative membrane protein